MPHAHVVVSLSLANLGASFHGALPRFGAAIGIAFDLVTGSKFSLCNRSCAFPVMPNAHVVVFSSRALLGASFHGALPRFGAAIGIAFDLVTGSEFSLSNRSPCALRGVDGAMRRPRRR